MICVCVFAPPLCRYCVSKDGELVCPTSFPIAQGIAASWNRSVFAAFGRVVGREARIWTNANGVAKSERPVGTSVRCPMVNLLRDPRWGCFRKKHKRAPRPSTLC